MDQVDKQNQLINLNDTVAATREDSEGHRMSGAHQAVNDQRLAGQTGQQDSPLGQQVTAAPHNSQQSTVSGQQSTPQVQVTMSEASRCIVPLTTKRPDISLADFIRSFELKAAANQMSDATMAVTFPALLEEDSVVHNQLAEMTDTERKSWARMKATLTHHEEPMRLQYLLKVPEIRFDTRKDPLKLKEEITKLIEKLYPKAAKTVKAQMLVDAYILSLPRELRSQVCLKSPKSIDEVLQTIEFVRQLQPENNGHYTRQPRPQQATYSTSSRDFSRQKQSYKSSRNESRPAKDKKKSNSCFKCGETGHWAKNCAKKEEVALVNDRIEPAVDSPRTMVDVSIDGKPCKVLFDNGSVASILPEDQFKPTVKQSKVFGTPNAGTLPTVGYHFANFDFNGLQINHSCYVGTSRVTILGQDFIAKHKVNLKHDRKIEFVLDDGKVYTLKGQSEQKKEELMDDSFKSGSYLTVDDDESEIEWIYTVNPKICYVFSDDTSEPCEAAGDQVQRGEQLMLSQWVERRWQHLFNGIGCSADIQHRIDTGDAKPFQARGRPLPIGLKHRIQVQIDEMLRDKVIEVSNSEWHSPIRPVEKPNGDIRLAINYRRLNQLTRTDAYPMPRMDEALLKLKGARILSKIDLRKGYYQIVLAKEDREKTAFSFDGQLYHFTRMPFGLATAPHTFIRLMHRIFHKVKHASVFFDDLVIFSDTVDEHKGHLAEVFTLLENHGLKLNKDKSVFGVSSVSFLGHVIGNDEVRPDPAKLNALRNYPEPRSLVELQRFLGMANFYRRFIANYGQLAKPLTKLTKCKDWHWSDEQTEAFKQVKQAMLKEPVVRLPDLSRPFIVKTDACMNGAGAILLQEDDDGNRYVIEYFSKAFNKAQLNYPVIEQEATALLWALEHWQYYLIGQQFTLETDHRPLQWLQSKKDCRGKLGRMSLRLQEFSGLTIKHIRGEDNADADALSRINAIDFELHSQLAKEQESDLALKVEREQQSEKFVLINQMLYFCETGNPDRLCIPRTRVQSILRTCHDVRAHLGYMKTAEHCRQRYYWPGMAKEIKQWIANCHKCATAKDNHVNSSVQQRATDVVSQHTWEKLSIDVVGPFAKSTQGNSYVVTLTDLFSKWPEIMVASEVTAESITKWLDEVIFPLHGYPREILTDHGPQFDSQHFKSYLKRHFIRHAQSTIYHHEANGQVERFNRTLENMIRCTVDAKLTNWDDYLHRQLFSYRTATHAATKVSPFRALFGREPRTVMDNKYPTRLHVNDELQQSITDNLQDAAEKRLTSANSKITNEPTYGVNDLIYWSVVPPSKCRKLQPRWVGPYEIVKVDLPNVTIRGSKGNQSEVHISQVKHCKNTSLPLAHLRTRKLYDLPEKDKLRLEREV